MTASDVLERLASSTTCSVRVEGATAGAGTGAVEAVLEGGAVALVEAGTWAVAAGRPVRWRSASRWRAEGDRLEVEHVRQGEPARVVLEAGPDGVWRGRPWPCGADLYAVEVREVTGAPPATLGTCLEVAWTARGPAKASRTATRYA